MSEKITATAWSIAGRVLALEARRLSELGLEADAEGVRRVGSVCTVMHYLGTEQRREILAAIGNAEQQPPPEPGRISRDWIGYPEGG